MVIPFGEEKRNGEENIWREKAVRERREREGERREPFGRGGSRNNQKQRFDFG